MTCYLTFLPIDMKQYNRTLAMCTVTLCGYAFKHTITKCLSTFLFQGKRMFLFLGVTYCIPQIGHLLLEK